MQISLIKFLQGFQNKIFYIKNYIKKIKTLNHIVEMIAVYITSNKIPVPLDKQLLVSILGTPYKYSKSCPHV